jgi:hypothetical protein
MVAGSVGQIGDLFTISLRMINVATGEILFTVSEDFQGSVKDLLSRATASAAAKLAKGAWSEIGKAAMAGRTGDLHVTTEPPGAAVEIDGKPVAGESPLTVQGIVAGEHRVVVRKGNFYGAQSVEIAPDALLKVRIDLSIGRGALKLFTTPADARVYFDGIGAGVSPLRFDDLPVGEHEVRVEKAGYLPQLSKVTVKLNEASTLSLTLKPAATLSILVNQKDASVYVNGVLSRRPGVRNYQVEAGAVEVWVEAPGFEPVKDSLTLAPNEHRDITINMVSIFGRLDVKSSPASATVALNQLTVGATPCFDGQVTPGNYSLTVKKPGYVTIRENVVLVKNQTLVRAYTLEHTQAYLDSVDQRHRRAHKQRQTFRRIAFGSSGACALGAGLVMNGLVHRSLHEQVRIQNDYNAATTDFAEFERHYKFEKQLAQDFALARNILYGVSGGLGFFFVLSIPF